MFDNEKLSVTYETLDVIMVNSIYPECYFCRNYFLIGDITVTIKVPYQLTLRFHKGICWDYFQMAVILFEENKEDFNPQIPYLS